MLKKQLYTIKHYFEPGIFPLTMAVALTVFGLLWKPLGLPNSVELAEIAEKLFAQYGIIILFIGAFIEGIFMVNLYFPGSFVILLAILVSDRSVEALSLIALVVWIGFALSAALNYYLGRYGFYKVLLYLGSPKVITRMRSWLDKKGKLAVLLAAIHPNFLAISLVCMGIAREGLVKSMQLALGGLLFWVPILTILTAIILPEPSESYAFYWYLVVIFFVWGIILVIKDWKKSASEHIPHGENFN